MHHLRFFLGSWCLSFLCALCVLCTLEERSWGADTWTTPFVGIRRLHRTGSNQNIHALVIDLCKGGVSLRATASSERGRSVPSFGQLVGAKAAINGDFFSFSGYGTDGLSMHAGQVWAGSKDHSYVAPIAIGAKRIEIPHHNNVNAVEPWMREIVSGHPTLLDEGVYVGNNGDPLCTNRHPRTAVGISKDHKTMIWVVVDGRASTRIGMTCQETASLLLGLGAWDAVNMDGGGSSTMWLSGVGVVNVPSDGQPRVVGNHLAVLSAGSGAAAHCPCKASCQGSKIIGDDCGVGDCAVFGATCADDAKGVRCVSVFCPSLGAKKVCLNEKLIGDCKDGAITTGDCSQFAAYCSTAGSSEARCVSAFCVKDAQTAPVTHDTCLPGGKRAACDEQGSPKEKPCPAGTICTIEAGVGRCVDPKATEKTSQETLPETSTEPIPTSEEPKGDALLEQEATQEGVEFFSVEKDEVLQEISIESFLESRGQEGAQKEGSGDVLYLSRENESPFVVRGCGCDVVSFDLGWGVLGFLLLGYFRRRKEKEMDLSS